MDDGIVSAGVGEELDETGDDEDEWRLGQAVALPKLVQLE